MGPLFIAANFATSTFVGGSGPGRQVRFDPPAGVLPGDLLLFHGKQSGSTPLVVPGWRLEWWSFTGGTSDHCLYSRIADGSSQDSLLFTGNGAPTQGSIAVYQGARQPTASVTGGPANITLSPHDYSLPPLSGVGAQYVILATAVQVSITPTLTADAGWALDAAPNQYGWFHTLAPEPSPFTPTWTMASSSSGSYWGQAFAVGGGVKRLRMLV